MTGSSPRANLPKSPSSPCSDASSSSQMPCSGQANRGKALLPLDMQHGRSRRSPGRRVSAKERLKSDGVVGTLRKPLHADRGRLSMRILALAILAVVTVSAAPPVRAQTYDPKYPVCLQVNNGWNDYYFECSYTSLAQCNMSASGRSAYCLVKPCYTGAKSPGRRGRQQ